MNLHGKLIAETPIYRGNARKTLFTRDGDGTQRLVSLAGEISGTASALMDAFIGVDNSGRNFGLLERLWRRLYGAPMPHSFITRVTCELQTGSYTRDHFFDLRMGLRLDEDRWSSEANANYKMETVFRNAVFDFGMRVDDAVLKEGDNAARLYYLLAELAAGRFWFGAGKSKGLGRLRLELDEPLPVPEKTPRVAAEANHLKISLTFDALNPLLVGWNWGKVDPGQPSFTAIEGQVLVAAMRDLPTPIRQRLEMVIGGPILNTADWKRKLASYLPRVIAVWLHEHSSGEAQTWVLTSAALAKLSKGKYALAKKVVQAAEPLCDTPFPSEEAAQKAFVAALEDKANMAGRLVKAMEVRTETRAELSPEIWATVAEAFGWDDTVKAEVAQRVHDEGDLTAYLTAACQSLLPRLYEQVDQQVNLLQSDAWVDAEISNREAHLKIKTLLLEGKISEAQWGSRTPPEGVGVAAWQTFQDEHRRVRYRHMLHPGNLRKSITNDRNFIAFLEGYRDRTRQELAQAYNVDFRSGGPANREVARKYGKPYDTVFMRMLTWSPSAQTAGAWEIYIPGSTLKGAFRRRASQVLKTLWGESRKTDDVLNRLFGEQGRVGMVFFSDAYLADPIDPDRAWCSMDGVRMDPATGQPVESAKTDYLFAYGNQLVFQMQLDIQDLAEDDLEAMALLCHLLDDFQRGDIPLGGEKTSGFGWVQADITALDWYTGNPQDVFTTQFLKSPALTQDGLWRHLTLTGDDAAAALQGTQPLTLQQSIQVPPTARAGFISHRAFGGNCGMLFLEAEVLTPLHIQESGAPSFRADVDGLPVNGWDFFSMSPPDAAQRPETRAYALPSRSLKGMLRHIYAIASDSRALSSDLSRLNPVDSLFGWVGTGTNQAIMGRLSISFGMFDAPELAWYKTPYPYSGWLYVPADKSWTHSADKGVPKHRVAQTWRLFPHTPLAPIVKPLDAFAPDTAQASYFRAILPGARARFSVRFWNLEDEELQRLLWCLTLEPNLAHKVGHHRYLGFGSLRLHLLPESYLIDWSRRYNSDSETDWQQPLDAEKWRNPRVIAHYTNLRQLLNADTL